MQIKVQKTDTYGNTYTYEKPKSQKTPIFYDFEKCNMLILLLYFFNFNFYILFALVCCV